MRKENKFTKSLNIVNQQQLKVFGELIGLKAHSMNYTGAYDESKFIVFLKKQLTE